MKTRVRSVRFGEPQLYRNIAILPLIAPADGKFQYHTLGEALASWDIAIREVSAAGSISELIVINRGHKPVLLVDGEELAGAKKNRALNASILLKGVSETKIPVSCTEQGRWRYISRNLSESGNLMAHKSRARKSRSVLNSLISGASFHCDQDEVWSDLAELQAKACVSSPTSAMSDVFEARAADLRQCDKVFKAVPNQVGLLAIIGDQPVGLDLVSFSAAYARLHPKLVRSYALEGLLVAPWPGESRLDTKTKPAALGTIAARAREFLAEAAAAEEHQFASVGHGTDHRYQGRALAGTALVHENEVIHAAFFRLNETA